MSNLKIKLTVFSSGFSIMLLEVLASRIIAPYHGSSTLVWSTIIGVILAAMSLGYIIGGRLADKNPSEKKLSEILLYCALLIFLLTLAKEIILPLTTILGIRAGSLAASVILLSAPSIYLGMVLPYAIKLASGNPSKVGGLVGSLYSLSALASIAGTLVAGYILLPTQNISRVLFGISLILLLLSLMWDRRGKKTEKYFIMAIVLAFMVFYNYSYYTPLKTLHLEYTPYDMILVDEGAYERYLHLDGTYEGGIRLTQNNLTVFDYINYFELAYIARPETKDVLVVGEGTGVGPRQIQINHPDSQITIAEINPRVHETAKKYFLLQENDNLKVKLGDIRSTIKTDTGKYDYVILDAFNGIYTIPYYLLTKEFFSELKERMNPGGVLLLNIITPVQGPKSNLFKSVVRTMNEEFSHIQIYPLEDDRSALQNVIVIASEKPLPEKQEMLDRTVDTPVMNKTKLASMINREAEDQLKPETEGIIYTDDFSPADSIYTSILT